MVLVVASLLKPARAVDLTSVFAQDVERFTLLLTNPAAELRIAGVQGLSYLKHWPAEENLIPLLVDASPRVRREVVLALGRLGTANAVPHLIRLLDDPSWELRQNAWLGLCRLTAQSFPAQPKSVWETWWNMGAVTNHEAALLNAVTHANPALPRTHALRALKAWVSPGSEEALMGLVRQSELHFEDLNFIAEALERIGTPKCVPTLAGLHSEAVAWALGRIGGRDAELALLNFPKTLAVLINLDRLESTNLGPIIPFLVSQMGLVTYRSQPDDLMNAEAQPIQRVGANLIRRSYRSTELVHQILLELEYSMSQPPAEPRPPMPDDWKPMLQSMRSELKPGFVREDGVTTSQPIAALYHVATNRALVPRLLPLLRHPAIVPRIYVAMTLAKLRAPEALPPILEMIREGYPFSDSVALASGKHFDQSQTVRWRGFLCMALGRLGGDQTRKALEDLATDPQQPRDIRYGSVVGLGFIGARESLAALNQVAQADIIWMIRDEARRVASEIELRCPQGHPPIPSPGGSGKSPAHL